MSEESDEKESAQDLPVGLLKRKAAAPPPAPEKPMFRNDEAKTPAPIVNYVMEEFGCNYDPCPENYVPGGPIPDGLATDWSGVAYVNPPQSQCQAWVTKAVEEQAKGHPSVLLVPFNAKSCYWKEIVYPNVNEIRILTCPIRFENHTKQQVTGKCLFGFFGRANGLAEMCLLYFAAEPQRNAGAPLTTFVEPPGWEEAYYKRARNRSRFRVKP